MISAVGHGGQFIYLVPDINLVISVSCVGGVEDSVSEKQFEEMEKMIVAKIIPYYLNR